MLEVDHERQRISLGLKHTQEDPWQRVVNTYHVGDELEGQVTKVVAFGAFFVEILEGVEGLVHISELAEQHIEKPREIVAPGDEIRVQILEIHSERRRLSALDQARRGPGPAARPRRGRRARGARGGRGRSPPPDEAAEAAEGAAPDEVVVDDTPAAEEEAPAAE